MVVGSSWWPVLTMVRLGCLLVAVSLVGGTVATGDQPSTVNNIQQQLISSTLKKTVDNSFWNIVEGMKKWLVELGNQTDPETVDEWTQCALGLSDILGSFTSNQSTTDDKMSALTMIDSGTKLPSGLLKGNIVDLGQFDECIGVERDGVAIRIPEFEEYTTSYTGQHCLVAISLSSPAFANAYINEGGQNISIHDLLGGDSITLTISQCYPSTCQPHMVEKMWDDLLEFPNKYFLNTLNASLSASVHPTDCHTSVTPSFDPLEWVVLAIVIFFIFVAAVCTTVDLIRLQKTLKTRKPNNLEQAALSFSVYTNGSKLFSTFQSPEQMNCLNGMKFVSICWVVLGHRYRYTAAQPLVNFMILADVIQQWDKMMILNATLSVDTFFLISGLLNIYVFLNTMEKTRRYNIFTILFGYVHRYIRLTPSYLMMIALTATWVYRLGDGPLWDRIVGNERNNCRQNWWANLIYLNNYLSQDHNCMMQSWYLAADMQMFWLSPLVLYPLYRWPVAGLANLGVLTAASVVVPFAVSYVDNIETPIPVSKDDARVSREMDALYLPTHTKTISYVCGIFVGYIIQKYKSGKLNFKMDKLKALIGWVIGLTCGLYGLFGCYPLFQMDHSFTQLEASLYLGFYRLLWSIGVGWIIFACVSGYGGIANWILSLNIFGPLGRLTYCIYLTHIAVEIYSMGSLRTAMYFSDYDMVVHFLGEIIIVIAISTVLSLLLESPIMGLEKIIFGRGRGSRPAARPNLNPPDTEAASQDSNNGQNFTQLNLPRVIQPEISKTK